MSESQRGIVTSSTRRYLELCTEDFKLVQAKLGSRKFDATVGDYVAYHRQGEELVTDRLFPRRNSLARSYEGKVKRLVANLDYVFLITASGALFNSVAIDRVLTAANSESIPVCLVVNKIDLEGDFKAIEPLCKIYEKWNYELIFTSAKQGIGLDRLVTKLNSADIKLAAFVGVSGVGKSTLLNALIPGADQRICEVSERTGQGRQTTSQTIAHILNRKEQPPVLIADLPGIQSFGVSHLDKLSVAHSFPEIMTFMRECRFSNCSHIREQDCGVRAAVERGDISASRYESYCGMIDEISSKRQY